LPAAADTSRPRGFPPRALSTLHANQRGSARSLCRKNLRAAHARHMQMPKSSDMQTPMQSGGVINPIAKQFG
jgi:hypothetical protein